MRCDDSVGPDPSQTSPNVVDPGPNPTDAAAEQKAYREAAARIAASGELGREAVVAIASTFRLNSFLRLGEILAAQQRPEAAAACYELAAEAADAGPGAHPFKRLERMRANLLLARFDEAFRVAERLLDAGPSAMTLEGLSNRISSDQGQEPISQELLARLQEYSAAHPESPWPVTLLVDVLHKLNRKDEAFLESGRLLSFPKRYGWMRYPRGFCLLLDRCDYANAKADFKAVIESAPVMWHARAHLAEVELCLGDHKAAFELFDELLRDISGPDRAPALGWRGALRLWIGDYQRALTDCESAVAAGGAPFARCWLGAAKMLLGRTNEALQDLDAYLRERVDAEGLIWRGETLRRLGRHREALADLDRALLDAHDPWALMNRGLARGALGDQNGLRSDFQALPPDIRSFLLGKTGLPDDLHAALETGLKLGRGVRRPHSYLFPIWMR